MTTRRINCKYQEHYPEEIVELMKQGYFDVEIFAKWGISKQLFYHDWLNKYPDLKAAHERGKEHREAWWIQKGRASMEKGDNKAFSHWIGFMNRYFGWSKNPNGGDSTTNIQIQNMNVLQAKSSQELLEIIKTKEQYLIDQGVIEATVIESGPNDNKPE